MPSQYIGNRIGSSIGRSIFRQLGRYIIWRLIVSFLVCFLIVFLLIAALDLIELLRGAQTSFANVALLAVMHAPSVSIKTMPFVMLLSAMAAYIRFSRSSEMVAARAAGASFWHLAGAGMVAAILIGSVGVTVLNPIAASALDYFERQTKDQFSVSENGVWLRDSIDDLQIVLNAQSSSKTGTMLRDVTLYEFNEAHRLTRLLIAQEAALEPIHWRLTSGVEWSFEGVGEMGVPAEFKFDQFLVPTNLTSERIKESFSSPETVSIWRMPKFIQQLESSGLSTYQHRVHFHHLLATPWLFAAMTLIAAAFAIRAPRFAQFGAIAMRCALTGFAFYFINDICLALGASGAASAVSAAWAPAIAAMMMGVAFALWFEGT